MKQLKISITEIINLKIPENLIALSLSFNDWYPLWIENRLKEIGFDMTKPIFKYRDFNSNYLIFEQEDK